MFDENKICNTCKNKTGKIFVAPISNSQYPCYSCKNYTLTKGYDYNSNSCSNYEKEVDE